MLGRNHALLTSFWSTVVYIYEKLSSTENDLYVNIHVIICTVKKDMEDLSCKKLMHSFLYKKDSKLPCYILETECFLLDCGIHWLSLLILVLLFWKKLFEINNINIRNVMVILKLKAVSYIYFYIHLSIHFSSTTFILNSWVF